jgi:hypothetical protein
VPSSCRVPPVASQPVSGQVVREVTDDALGTSVLFVRRVVAEYLDQAVDHRSRQRLHYELEYVLAMVVAATACTGHDEVAAHGRRRRRSGCWPR